MAHMGKFDAKGLKDLQKKLNKLQNPDAFVESCAKELAIELWDMLIHETPVKSGTLKNGWTIGSVEKTGGVYKIEIINPTKYATYVEYGHMQEPGRYVPAIGKRLVKRWVKGRFFMTKSVAQVEKMTPKILEDEIREYLKDFVK